MRTGGCQRLTQTLVTFRGGWKQHQRLRMRKSEGKKHSPHYPYSWGHFCGDEMYGCGIPMLNRALHVHSKTQERMRVHFSVSASVWHVAEDATLSLYISAVLSGTCKPSAPTPPPLHLLGPSFTFLSCAHVAQTQAVQPFRAIWPITGPECLVHHRKQTARLALTDRGGREVGGLKVT